MVAGGGDWEFIYQVQSHKREKGPDYYHTNIDV